jgi:hypothetical protein
MFQPNHAMFLDFTGISFSCGCGVEVVILSLFLARSYIELLIFQRQCTALPKQPMFKKGRG